LGIIETPEAIKKALVATGEEEAPSVDAEVYTPISLS
jgi:hypothetical protein